MLQLLKALLASMCKCDVTVLKPKEFAVIPTDCCRPPPPLAPEGYPALSTILPSLLPGANKPLFHTVEVVEAGGAF